MKILIFDKVVIKNKELATAMETGNIHQTITIKALPIEVYDAFMTERKHQEFTGYNASIENKVGGKFITCGKRNFGYTLFLQPGERIIQAWAQIDFPDNQYSIIDIRLSKTKEGYTSLLFHQLGAPADSVEWLEPGWKSTYWLPLKKYLEEGIVQPLRE